MKLSDFDYELPKELIAQFPSPKRGEERMLVLDRKTGSIAHRSFCDFKEYLFEGDTLILNNARVNKARLIGKKRGSDRKAEVFLLNPLGAGEFQALIRPLSKLRIGDEVVFDHGDLTAKILAKDRVVFNCRDEGVIYRYGEIPLPPYIKRRPQSIDEERYQTVFAESDGAVAAPTAGLHFDLGTLSDMRGRGANVGFLTLKVGVGTFRPVRAEDITSHHMEREYFQIDEATRDLASDTRADKRKVFAVGTTVVRVLESIFGGYAQGLSGFTDLFIYPGFEFKAVDCLLTNFHLPRTTLLMLTAAFAGQDLIMEAYRQAIAERYRFYSYGDCMLIL